VFVEPIHHYLLAVKRQQGKFAQFYLVFTGFSPFSLYDLQN
jgi:hypothetical protein